MMYANLKKVNEILKSLGLDTFRRWQDNRVGYVHRKWAFIYYSKETDAQLEAFVNEINATFPDARAKKSSSDTVGEYVTFRTPALER